MDAESCKALCRPDRGAALSLDQAIAAFHVLSPRCRFVKTLPRGGSLLDAGAGDGSLQVYRTWPDPPRKDLQMFAWAGIKGGSFDSYDGYEIGVWPGQKPAFGGRRFDAVLAANFIEHIDDPVAFVEFTISLLTPGGRLYLEWPRPESIALPTASELAELGVNVMTGNYFDDATHRADVPDFGMIRDVIVGRGLIVRESGIAAVPFVDQELAIHAGATGDIVLMTLAYWSITGWCRFIVAEMPAFEDSPAAERCSAAGAAPLPPD